jgi:DNA-binding NtrC family response regulator
MAKVLVVDDDMSSRGFVLRLLQQAGYDTAAASTFEEARQMLTTEEPDLLVTDLRLEGFNGLQLIIANHRRPIPSIVITGFADPSLETEAKRLGADYLVKPFSQAALLGLVAQKLKPRAMSDERT